MAVKINNGFGLFWAFLIITFSGSYLFYANGKNTAIEYIGLFLLLIIVLKKFRRMSIGKIQSALFFRYFPALFFFSLGILLQDMPLTVKIKLTISMMLIATYASLSENVLDSYKEIRSASYGILAGILLVFIVSIITGSKIFSGVTEGLVSWGLSMGMKEKNSFGMDLIAAFTGIYIYYKSVERKKVDLLVMWLITILVIASHARIAWLLFLFLIGMLNIKKVLYIKKKHRRLFIIFSIIVAAILLLFTLQYTIRESENIAIRVRGLTNWLNYFKGDWFHLLFGNAALAWADTSLDYTRNVRSVTGWNGTLEMAFLGILIKNGALGFVGYIIFFAHYMKCTLNMENVEIKDYMISLLSVALLSMISESFMINLAVTFGTYYYILMSGMIGLEKKLRSPKI